MLFGHSRLLNKCLLFLQENELSLTFYPQINTFTCNVNALRVNIVLLSFEQSKLEKIFHRDSVMLSVWRVALVVYM